MLPLTQGVSGPTSFGLSSGAPADSGSGSFVGIYGTLNRLYVPAGYVSNSPLMDTATFDNATFASLGFTPGTYNYTFGSGPNADFLTVTGVASPIPEPSTYALALLGGAGLLGAVRRGRVARLRV